MSRFTISLLSIALLISAVMLAGHSPASSDSSKGRGGSLPVIDTSHRSKAPRHKLIVYAHEQELRDTLLAEGGEVIEDYGAFSLISAPAAVVNTMSADENSAAAVRDDMNVIYLRAGAFDTTDGEPVSPASLGEPEPAAEQLYLVQMVGPVKQEWLDALGQSAEIISYVPNNAYLVRADAAGLERINNLKSARKGFVQWAGGFKPGYKIAPELSLSSDREVTVTVQLAAARGTRGEAGSGEVRRLASVSMGEVIGEPVEVLNYTNVRMRVHSSRLAEIARQSDVVWIEPWVEPELLDEKQGLIIAGNFIGNQLSPPGYLAWLRSKGITTTPDFVVDVADSGIDQGNLDPVVLHKDFLNASGLSRVVYARLVSTPQVEGSSNDTGGHGTINAAIVGGFNTNTSFPYVDAAGYSFGLGVHPFVKLGITKIFNPEFTTPNFVTMVDAMYRDGARISSNSWGAYNNGYTTDCQIYDSLVRDARRGEQGNQELTILFASGNRGAGGNLSTPSTAKNVITVGASENLRDGFDGCNVPPEGGDDIQSIIKFSSSGPCDDGRLKPEIVAPGTHIQGARSQDPGFNGTGVCGPMDYPVGQSLYTWSSGTSHSTPAVAGAAALVRHFFLVSTGKAPSPAMVKAYLTNSTSYMTGVLAGGNLPHVNQGWGLMNVGRALDNVARTLIDQDQVLAATGGVISVKGKVNDPTKPFRVTLAWTDAPGAALASPVVNDLDLQVTIGGKTYFGNRFLNGTSIEGNVADKLNNIEGVWLPEGTTGDFEIRVVAANIAGDGVPGNSDTTDQDFALVVYNTQTQSNGGGGGGNPLDAPPTVNLKYPVGHERLMVGNLVRVLWDASDDKQIQSQRVEFSADSGATFNTIGVLDGKARSFDWKIPSVPTPFGVIKVTALDGVNLPVSAANTVNFVIENGPPDTAPPAVLMLAPSGDAVIGGGLPNTIRWRESDNVGVIQRVIEFSTDNGSTWQQIISLTAPSSGDLQSYDWQVPAALSTERARIRITVYDGASNSATITSVGKFQIWPMPIINRVDYDSKSKTNDRLEVFGRNFRIGETEIYVNGRRMKKIRFENQCDSVDGTCNRVASEDKKIHKRVPVGEFSNIVVKFPKTNQVSPEFQYKRKGKE
jgi:subtilisin family serine protease